MLLTTRPNLQWTGFSLTGGHQMTPVSQYVLQSAILGGGIGNVALPYSLQNLTPETVVSLG